MTYDLSMTWLCSGFVLDVTGCGLMVTNGVLAVDWLCPDCGVAGDLLWIGSGLAVALSRMVKLLECTPPGGRILSVQMQTWCAGQLCGRAS